jgi:hypothetical protein
VRPSGVGLVAIAMLVAACSDDGTTKDEFVARADAICHEANDQARALGAEPPILTPAHATWLVALTESDNAALDRLQELERPPSDLATIGTLVTELEECSQLGLVTRAG